MSSLSTPQVQLPTPQDTPSLCELDEPSPASYVHHSTSWTPVDSMTPVSTNPSRKRSRDESAFDAETVDGSYFSEADIPEPIAEEPIYGEGMVLLNPRTGMSISAESQTGTWYEEKAEEEEKNQPTKSDFRPKMPSSRKSIRLSQSSLHPLLESAPASPPKMVHPEVDEATIALGIGWTKIASEDADIQAAARGWARYLDNHYTPHLHGAEMLLKSAGLNAYLVGSPEGFFLFSESLLEGRLVGRTWETCLRNLRAQPIEFEGTEILRAERTPGPDFTELESVQMDKIENLAEPQRFHIQPGGGLANGSMDVD